MNKYETREYILEVFKKRGVELKDIGKLVVFLQEKYIPNITLEDAIQNVYSVLEKREVQNAILTGIELDILAEKKLLSEPLLSMILKDDGLYGMDEIIVMSIVNVYGSIGYTNFGYIDKIKPQILGELDKHVEGGQVNTFLDDIVGAIAAAAASRMAHRHRDQEENVE